MTPINFARLEDNVKRLRKLRDNGADEAYATMPQSNYHGWSVSILRKWRR